MPVDDGGPRRGDAGGLLAAIGEIRAERRRADLRFLTRGVVDQAVGVLLARGSDSAPEALGLLSELAGRTGRPIQEIAADLVGQTLPGDLAGRLPAPSVLADLDRAGDEADVTGLLVGEALGWTGVGAVAVSLLSPDGMLQLIACAGFPDAWAAQWRRVPVDLDCLLGRALKALEPVWIDASTPQPPLLFGDPAASRAPDRGTRLAVPLMFANRPVGAAEFAWPAGRHPDRGRRREVAAVAGAVGASLARSAQLGVKPPAQASGRAGDVDRWATLEHLGRLGSWDWDLRTGLVRWSAQALMILGSRSPAAVLPVDSPPFTVQEDDAPAMRRFMAALAAEGRSADVELRIVRQDGQPARIRLAGEPDLDEAGRCAAVSGVVQDTSDLRRTETALEAAQIQIAVQRARLRSERQVAALLQRIIVPAEPVSAPWASGMAVAARYRPANIAAGVGGDWYGVFPLPDSTVLLTIGDVAGHGLSAASAMAQLYHTTYGLALSGAGPAALLHWLNSLTYEREEFTIASSCCALYDPRRRVLRWANAGHPSPVLVTARGAAVLEAPIGTMLGAGAGSVYQEEETAVEAGSHLLLYTDGLIEHRKRSHEQTTAALLAAAADPEADLDDYADRILADADSDTDDDVCLIAVRFHGGEHAAAE